MQLINQKAVRQLALDMSARHREGRFTRVSKTFLEDAELWLREYIYGRVHRHPSLGKTLK